MKLHGEENLAAWRRVVAACEVVLSSLVRHLTVKTEEGFYEMVF